MLDQRINILIAEPSLIVSGGLQNMLSPIPKIGQLVAVSNLPGLKIQLQKFQFDLLILNPVLLQGTLKSFLDDTHTCIPVISLVYTYCDPQILAQFQSQIDLFDSQEILQDKIQKLLVAPGVKEELVNTLSDREIDVLRLLVSGKTNKEIADGLNISTHTVISHRKNISSKTGIKSVPGLTIYAVLQNIINLENVG